MRIQLAFFSMLTAAVCSAGEALAECRKDFYFKDGNLCAANRARVIELIKDPTFQTGFLNRGANGYAEPSVTACSRALRCPISGCSVTVSLTNGENRACNQLQAILTEQKTLTGRLSHAATQAGSGVCRSAGEGGPREETPGRTVATLSASALDSRGNKPD